MIHELTKESDFEPMLSSSGRLYLVDFYADWCEPCKWLDQILIDIEPDIKAVATIIKVDVEKFQTLRETYDIKGIPVLMVIKNGQIVWRMNGFLLGNELIAKVNSLSMD